MSSKAAEMLGHPPGLKFRPDDDELVEFFLLPRVRGELSWFPGVIVIDDDTAGNTHPSKLLERHGLAGDKDAYFFMHTTDAAARQDRHCAGGGRWVSQKPVPNGACIGGQEVQWRRVNLNLQPSRGKSGGGSNGWRARVAAAAANIGSSTCVYGLTAPGINQGYSAGAYFPIGQGMSASNQQLLDGTYYLPANTMPYMESEGIQATQLQPVQSSTWSIPFAASAAGADSYVEQAPLTTQQHQPVNQQLQPLQSFSGTCAYGSTTTVADQDSSAAAATDEENLEWFRDYGKDFLADAAEATTENAMMPQQMTSGEDEGNQQLLHGNYLPADGVPCMELQERLQTTRDQVIQDAQLQSVESSFWNIPSAAELFPQHGLDEQEKQFWRSIGVDTENIVC
ncbi:unnamed protein product [Urochloa decumbens]|uniref:NAC domain-containing protein n=1 Tax=Urochloa decumbens TaxID=240449 RepID=A0ABC8VD04_9POAL